MNGFAYKLFFSLHILAIIAAFAPAFVWPVVTARLKREQKPVGPTIGALAAGNTARIHGPALVLAGFFGFGLVGLSDKAWKFSQAWVSVGMLIWFLMLGVLFAMLLPAEKKMAAGDEGAEKMVSMSGGILSLLLVVQIIVMVWKPGI